MAKIEEIKNSKQIKIGMMTWDADKTKTGVPYYIDRLISTFKNEGRASNLYLYHWKKIFTETMYEKTNEIIIKYLPCNMSYFLNLPLAIKKEKINLLHFPVPTLNQVIPALLIPRIKYVMTVHDITPYLFPEMHTKKTIFSFDYAIKISKSMINQYITVSENTKKDLIKYYKIPEEIITVIYPGKDSRFSPAINKEEIRKNLSIKLNLQLEEPYILSVGTIEPRKNVKGLIKAYFQLKRRGVKYKLVIVGMKGWKYAPIFDLIKDLKLEKDIIFPGYVKEEDMPDIYKGAEIFVYPSFYEGFGSPPLEAMACGIPVIVSNTSSLPEVVGSAGILIDPNNTEEITNAMNDLINSKEKQIYCSEEGLKQASKFNWEKTAEETWKIYEKIMYSEKK